jgi:hypothetical protein
MVRTTGGGECGDITVASVYLPFDADIPPRTKEMRDVINYCYSRREQFILGCNANAHHTLWGSINTDLRGKALTEYLVSSKFNILNQGNELTFVVCGRKEVIDLTLGTNKINKLLNNWRLQAKQAVNQ